MHYIACNRDIILSLYTIQPGSSLSLPLSPFIPPYSPLLPSSSSLLLHTQLPSVLCIAVSPWSPGDDSCHEGGRRQAALYRAGASRVTPCMWPTDRWTVERSDTVVARTVTWWDELCDGPTRTRHSALPRHVIFAAPRLASSRTCVRCHRIQYQRTNEADWRHKTSRHVDDGRRQWRTLTKPISDIITGSSIPSPSVRTRAALTRPGPARPGPELAALTHTIFMMLVVTQYFESSRYHIVIDVCCLLWQCTTTPPSCYAQWVTSLITCAEAAVVVQELSAVSSTVH